MCTDCFNITQLHDVKVRRMAELLEKTQSSYFPAFKKIFKDVVAGKFFLAFCPQGVFFPHSRPLSGPLTTLAENLGP